MGGSVIVQSVFWQAHGHTLFAGSIVLHIELTHESWVIQMKLLLRNKIKSSRSQQLDSKDINQSDHQPL